MLAVLADKQYRRDPKTEQTESNSRDSNGGLFCPVLEWCNFEQYSCLLFKWLQNAVTKQTLSGNGNSKIVR